MLIAVTARGVCAVALGDDDAGLVASLRAEYPQADVEKAPSALRTMLTQVTEHLAGRLPMGASAQGTPAGTRAFRPVLTTGVA